MATQTKMAGKFGDILVDTIAINVTGWTFTQEVGKEESTDTGDEGHKDYTVTTGGATWQATAEFDPTKTPTVQSPQLAIGRRVAATFRTSNQDGSKPTIVAANNIIDKLEFVSEINGKITWNLSGTVCGKWTNPDGAISSLLTY